VAQWLQIGADKRCWNNGLVAGRGGGGCEWWCGGVVASAAKRHEHYVIMVDADLFARAIIHSASVSLRNASNRERCVVIAPSAYASIGLIVCGKAAVRDGQE
jgi:hypothetical protein